LGAAKLRSKPGNGGKVDQDYPEIEVAHAMGNSSTRVTAARRAASFRRIRRTEDGSTGSMAAAWN
jgi:hypothetical protein